MPTRAPLLRDAGVAEDEPLRRRRVAVLRGQPREIDVVAQRRRRDVAVLERRA